MRRFLLTEQFTLMESEGKRLNQRTQKTGNGRTLLRLLHGSWSYFLVCIVSGLVFTGCELLIPQIIRVSVDSFIGNAAVHVRAAERVVAALGGDGAYSWCTLDSGRGAGGRRPALGDVPLFDEPLQRKGGRNTRQDEP